MTQFGVISDVELRDIRNKTISGQKHDAIIISNDELMRIRNNMAYKSPEQELDAKKMALT